MSQDWVGSGKGLFKIIGASNHTDDDREERDFYATHPSAAQLLIDQGFLDKSVDIWECAAGQGHLAEVFKQNGYKTFCTDIIQRDYPLDKVEDFLSPQMKVTKWGINVVTNPPYKYAQEFVERALHIIDEEYYVCMFLKLTFLEGKKRKRFFLDNPPKVLYVSSSRILCAKDGNFGKLVNGSAVAYGWYVWQKGYMGDTIIKWIN